MERLTENNYPVWEVRMRAMLVSKELWSITDPNGEDNESIDSLKSGKAFSMIILALDENEIVKIEQCETARDTWKKLQGIYVE